MSIPRCSMYGICIYIYLYLPQKWPSFVGGGTSGLASTAVLSTALLKYPEDVGNRKRRETDDELIDESSKLINSSAFTGCLWSFNRTNWKDPTFLMGKLTHNFDWAIFSIDMLVC